MSQLFVKLRHCRMKLECKKSLFLFSAFYFFVFAVLAQKERFGSINLAAVLKKNCFQVNMFRNALKKSAMERVLDAIVTKFSTREFT